MSITRTVWKLDDHTKGKHDVLEEYLKAWYPILMNSKRGRSKRIRVVFIDAFAGPGEYVGGERGSPVIAMDSLRLRPDVAALTQAASVTFVFIEKNKKREAHLREVVIPRMEGRLPDGTEVQVRQGAFSEEMTEILDRLDEHRDQPAPSLVMIDPFGYTDYPLSLVKRILSNKSAEVLITFMGSSVNRWGFETPEAVTSTFGTDEWKGLLGDDIASDHIRADRRKNLISLYEAQLRKAGAKYVLPFDVYRTERDYVYTLFFATGDSTGCARMKEAMWRVAPGGDYRFVGARKSQFSMTAFSEAFVDYTGLASDLIAKFGHNNWITLEAALEFMATDGTGFLPTHLREKALKPMEEDGRLAVERPRRGGAFIKDRGIRIMFPDTSTRLL